MDKIYHIDVKNKCVRHSLSEEQFKIEWSTLNLLAQLLDCQATESDLSYEELDVMKNLEMSH
jgi:hypothetical protein